MQDKGHIDQENFKLKNELEDLETPAEITANDDLAKSSEPHEASPPQASRATDPQREEPSNGFENPSTRTVTPTHSHISSTNHSPPNVSYNFV